jgi:predicted nucleic acid-binding protein
MTPSMKSVVFDSHAILRFAQDEAGAEKVEELLKAAEDGNIRALMNEINLGEIFYVITRRLGVEAARRFLEQFTTLTVERIPASWEIIESASQIKAEYAVSYADCFAAATALKYSAAVVTGDPEFKKIGHLVVIDWI